MKFRKFQNGTKIQKWQKFQNFHGKIQNMAKIPEILKMARKLENFKNDPNFKKKNFKNDKNFEMKKNLKF